MDSKSLMLPTPSTMTMIPNMIPRMMLPPLSLAPDPPPHTATLLTMTMLMMMTTIPATISLSPYQA
jgi:hypothetical protein